MSKLRLLDLFSGIGGFSLGLERTGGFETVAFCEIEDYPRRVLAKHWPEVHCYEDIRELDATTLQRHGIEVDAICGGFPCQDISTAGNGAGIEGERSGLWSEYARLIGELRPQVVFVENVAALLGRGLDKVLGDLASIGYDAEWHCIPASAVGAPHRRDRLWIIANANSARGGYRAKKYAEPEARHNSNDNRPLGGFPELVASNNADSGSDVADTNESRLEGRAEALRPKEERRGYTGHVGTNLGSRWRDTKWPTEPGVGRVANGVPDRTHRLKALGNAVVPQIPELLGNAYLASLEDAA